MILNLKTANGDTLFLSNLQAVKTFVGSGGGGSVATDAIWDAKGDLAVGTGANTASRLAVGTDGKQVYADADEATGLRWGAYVISPSQITTDQDDYNPTGWDEAQIVRISSDVGCHTITSFAATFDGDTKRVVNIGSYPISLVPQHTDGTAANRIADYGSVYMIFPGRAAEIWYDGTDSRWRINNDYPNIADQKAIYENWMSGSTVVGNWGNWASTVSGTGASVSIAAGSGDTPAAHVMSAGTTSTGSSAIYFSQSTVDIAGFTNAHMAATWYITTNATLSNGTNRFIYYLTIDASSSTSTLNNNSIGVRYSDDINSGKWLGFSRDNSGSETTVDLGVTVTGGDKFLIRVEVNKEGTEAFFFIDGVKVGQVAANMPNAVNAGMRAMILKSVGTTSRSMYLHSFNFLAIYP